MIWSRCMKAIDYKLGLILEKISTGETYVIVHDKNYGNTIVSLMDNKKFEISHVHRTDDDFYNVFRPLDINNYTHDNMLFEHGDVFGCGHEKFMLCFTPHASLITCITKGSVDLSSICVDRIDDKYILKNKIDLLFSKIPQIKSANIWRFMYNINDIPKSNDT